MFRTFLLVVIAFQPLAGSAQLQLICIMLVAFLTGEVLARCAYLL